MAEKDERFEKSVGVVVRTVPVGMRRFDAEDVVVGEYVLVAEVFDCFCIRADPRRIRADVGLGKGNAEVQRDDETGKNRNSVGGLPVDNRFRPKGRAGEPSPRKRIATKETRSSGADHGHRHPRPGQSI